MSTVNGGLNGKSNEGLPLIVAWLVGWSAMILANETVTPMTGLTKWGGAIVAVVDSISLGHPLLCPSRTPGHLSRQ